MSSVELLPDTARFRPYLRRKIFMSATNVCSLHKKDDRDCNTEVCEENVLREDLVEDLGLPLLPRELIIAQVAKGGGERNVERRGDTFKVIVAGACGSKCVKS
jgi:hypothetical protein